MSNTTSTTHYDFNIQFEHNNTLIEGSFGLVSTAGVDDALAVEILQALNGVSWPSGVTRPVSVLKWDDTSTTYTTDMGTTPPVFT